MIQTLHTLALAAFLMLPVYAVAQEPIASALDDNATTETDLGTLQAELARVEAERQGLAQRLANSADNTELQKLREANRALQNRQIEDDVQAQSLLEKQRQQWFMIGAGTVLISLLLGFALARGNKRKRNEWIN
ncbi:MAG: hypothetical protein ACJAXR_002755 [Halopseudomonas sp.]|jgi:hypothetical protein|uniref:hypothetical protein n=1 Tax=Halopseudomonas sp. TaxID=2901191 RepID=UPI0039E645B6